MPIVIMVVVFAWVVSMAGEKVDPTGVMRRLLEMERTHSEAVQSFLGHLKLDYHPDFGKIGRDVLPVHPEGWNEAYVAELFPRSKIVKVESITRAEFSGTTLAGHRAENGSIFYVWHRYTRETGVFVTVQVEGSSEPRTAMAINRGGNPVYLSSDDLVCRIDGHLVSMRMVKW